MSDLWFIGLPVEIKSFHSGFGSRIIVPSSIRNYLHIEKDDYVDVLLLNECFIVRKHKVIKRGEKWFKIKLDRASFRFPQDYANTHLLTPGTVVYLYHTPRYAVYRFAPFEFTVPFPDA